MGQPFPQCERTWPGSRCFLSWGLEELFRHKEISHIFFLFFLKERDTVEFGKECFVYLRNAVNIRHVRRVLACE